MPVVLKMRGSVPVQRSLMLTRMATWISTSPDTWIGPSILKQNVSTFWADLILPAWSLQPTSWGQILPKRGGGTFIEETRTAGFSGPVGHGLACTAGDINGDGWDDVYVANDQTPNFLWINNRDGTFSEQAVQLGCATSNTGKARAGMSATMIDIDGDLDIDIHVSNLEGESDGMFVNQDGQFIDQSAAKALAGSSRKMTRWGATFGDWDLDGHLEMFTACGMVLQTSQSDAADPYAERDMLHEITEPTGRFEPQPLDHRATNARAALTSDLDGDHFPELIVTTAWSKPMFMRHLSQEREDKAFTLIRVMDNGLPAVGAIVDVHTKEGSIIRHRVRRDGGYATDTPPLCCAPTPPALSSWKSDGPTATRNWSRDRSSQDNN